MNFGEYIKGLREEAGYTQRQLALYAKVSNTEISKIESGERKKPSPEVLKKLAPYLKVSFESLMVAAGYLPGEKDIVDLLDILERNNELLVGGKPITSEQRLAALRGLDNPSTLQSKTVPILGKIKMGIPILAEGNWDGELEIPSDIRADFALKARGNSMIGVGLLDGDYAICREAKTANSGNIVVALRDISAEYSEATLKYYFNDRERPVLRAANPDFEDIPMDDEWRIAGILVAILRKEPPAYRVYNSYLAARDINMEKWEPVLERAFQLGIKPEQVMNMLETMYQVMRGR